tara:strand:+ start:5299 stop:5700 length:402 start_codon:yes stop_codon:yes gene_type:complete
MKKSLFLTAIIAILGIVGCESPQSGTAVGAGTGALVGAIAGNNIDGLSKAEGAIAGAVVGGVIGNVQGRQQGQIKAMQGEIAAQNQTVINVRNSNGSTTPVVLQRSGNGWQGPRGEIYETVPSESQLKSVYGF